MFGRFLKDLKEYSYLSRYMARTGLKAEVANSYLNWVWWVLEPFCMMLVYTVVFGVIGTRLYYVLTKLDEFHSFYDVIAIWTAVDRPTARMWLSVPRSSRMLRSSTR